MRGASIVNWLFACSKTSLRMSQWGRSKQELILVQIWVVLILSHIVYALRERLATAATCEPSEVSVPLLLEVRPKLCSTPEIQLERLTHGGRPPVLVRASRQPGLV